MARPAARRRATLPVATPATGRVAEPRTDTVVCPRCGRFSAKIIGRSETLPVVYLRCDGCQLASVAAA